MFQFDLSVFRAFVIRAIENLLNARHDGAVDFSTARSKERKSDKEEMRKARREEVSIN